MAPLGRSGGRHDGAVGVAVVGAGYWGPNLVRNLLAADGVDLRWVCDLDEARARQVLGARTTVRTTTSLDDVLSDPLVTAVAVATPAATHRAIAGACLDAGRHVLVEKPLACTTGEAEDLVRRAETADVVLMCDHTYCYSPPARYLHDLLHSDEAGDLQYLDSVRINLGLVQPDVDVFWDLAPHDLSILDFILPGGLRPTAVSAQGADPLNSGKSCVGYLSLPLENGAMAHIHVNWLSPTKIRQMVIGGSRRTLVWDDLNPQQRISVFDRGVDLGRQERDMGDLENRKGTAISYRLGDTWSPALSEFEPLGLMVGEFAASIREGRNAPTDGESALRVLAVLEAASESLANGGQHRHTAAAELEEAL
jgi:predicted dehydrogenase